MQVFGARLGIGHAETPSMLQRRHGLARGLDLRRIDPGEENAGLDAAFRGALRGLLDEMMAAGTTLVAIAHDEDEDIVALTRRVCIIENGTISVEQRTADG